MYNVTCISRQQSEKHLLAQALVARQQSARQWAGEIAIMWLVFYGVRAATFAMQWFGKHISTIETVFSVWSLPRLYSESRKLQEFRRGQGSYNEIVAAEARKQGELDPRSQKSTRSQPVNIWRVIWRKCSGIENVWFSETFMVHVL
jgi:hypothetical protein